VGAACPPYDTPRKAPGSPSSSPRRHNQPQTLSLPPGFAALPFFLGLIIGDCVNRSVWTLVNPAFGAPTFCVWMQARLGPAGAVAVVIAYLLDY
jgi:hypothetical protein